MSTYSYMRNIKKLEAKTENARKFIAKHGDLFQAFAMSGPKTLIIHGMKNGENLSCEMLGDQAYINGEPIKWS